MKTNGMNRYNNYKDYTVEQFLNDEMFVRSVLDPTEETERYWNELVSTGALDIYTYTDAVLILTGWKQSVPVVGKKDLDALWQRIETDISKEESAKQKAGSAWKRVAIPVAVVAVAAAVILLPRMKGRIDPDEFRVEPGFVVKTQAQESDKVVIVSDSKELFLEGNNPEIQYDQEGVLNVTVTDSGQKEESIPVTAVPSPTQDIEFNQISVPYGKTASLTLSDGTILRINAGTKISYPKLFPESSREIKVDGEIFADVARDGRPFIIHTKDMDVKVTGTRFNLSSYTTDDYSQVVLVSGSVDISHEGGKVSLMPRQAFTITPDNASVQLVNPDLYTAWTKGMLRFEDESLENVLVKLARFYNVTLVLPERPSGVICYGNLELKENLTTILSGLTEIASFNFVIRDNAYVVNW